MFRREPKVASVSINLFVEIEEGEPDSLLPELVVGGERLEAFENGPIDLWELERSLSDDGTYFVWTCSCGEPGCAGRFKGVEVKHSGDLIVWKDLDLNRCFSFKSAELIQALASADQEGSILCAQRPELEPTPGRNRSRFTSQGEQAGDDQSPTRSDVDA